MTGYIIVGAVWALGTGVVVAFYRWQARSVADERLQDARQTGRVIARRINEARSGEFRGDPASLAHIVGEIAHARPTPETLDAIAEALSDPERYEEEMLVCELHDDIEEMGVEYFTNHADERP